MALKYEHSWLRRNIKAKDIRRALTDAYKAGLAGKEKPTEKTVSYTHLTLPTIYSV